MLSQGGKNMKKKILIGSILAVALLTLVSFSSAVGKVSLEPVPDLDCDGDISIVDVKPNSTHYGISKVFNIGDPGSILDWEIESYPEWGNWTFDPNSNIGIEAGKFILINITIIAPPDSNTEFEGELTFINSNDPSDFCIVDISLTTELKVQRVRELVRSIELQNVIVNPDAVLETLEDISTIIEEEDVRSYIEKSSGADCGCEDEPTLDGEYPIICDLLNYIYIIVLGLKLRFFDVFIGIIITFALVMFNCY
jgi:hypothetical protein